MASSRGTVWRGVANPVRAFGEPAVGQVVLDLRHVQAQVVLGHDVIAEVEDLLQVVSGVDVQQRERQRCRPERLDRQVQQHRGVLAAREQDHRAFELARDLTEDVDGFRLERVERVELRPVQLRPDGGFGEGSGDVDGHEACNPHSVLA